MVIGERARRQAITKSIQDSSNSFVPITGSASLCHAAKITRNDRGEEARSSMRFNATANSKILRFRCPTLVGKDAMIAF